VCLQPDRGLVCFLQLGSCSCGSWESARMITLAKWNAWPFFFKQWYRPHFAAQPKVGGASRPSLVYRARGLALSVSFAVGGWVDVCASGVCMCPCASMRHCVVLSARGFGVVCQCGCVGDHMEASFFANMLLRQHVTADLYTALERASTVNNIRARTLAHLLNQILQSCQQTN
jgi:hypothetical protein